MYILFEVWKYCKIITVLTEIDNGLAIVLNLLRKDLGYSKPAMFWP
jgi:hypothetical protein